MANGKYEPPKQSAFGQIFDTLFLLALVLGSLFAPVWMGLAAGAKTSTDLTGKSWTEMGQSAAQQAAWEKLGQTVETAAPVIGSRYDYTFDMVSLVVTAAVVAAYFLLVIRFSDQEYRDVIRERFGDK
ncbi:MAG: hypothetical protein ABL907_04670 [Hyphomicrobium sp.]